MTNKDSADDIRRISQAMDVLAKLVLEKRKDDGALQLEYKKKLDELDKLIGLILGLSNGNAEGEYAIDRSQIDRFLVGGVDIVERPDPQSQESRKYALVPIVENSNKVKKKRKKNKIACSFCHEIGHTRAKCETRLIYTAPKDS